MRLNQGLCTDLLTAEENPRIWNNFSYLSINIYGEYLMKEALTEVGDFNIGGRIINKVRFADDTAIIAKTQEELQDMVNRLVDTGRKYGMAINIGKSQVMRVSRSSESLQIKVSNRGLKEIGLFK